MSLFKKVLPLLLAAAVFQPLMARGCLGYKITQGGTNWNGATKFSVPAIQGADYWWSVTGDLQITSGQGTPAIWVSGNKGTIYATRDVNSFHCYTWIPVDFGKCGNNDDMSVYISGDFALDLYEEGRFYANPSGGSGQYTYRWYRSDTDNGNSVVGKSSSYGAQYVEEGTYWVRVEVFDGCGLMAASGKFIEVGCGFECEQ